MVRYAAGAVKHYGLDGADVRFIRHNENMTFKVTDTSCDADYLLRIHKPSSANFSGPRQQPEYIESELLWLEALAVDTDLRVQRVIKDVDGNLVSTVGIDGVPTSCTLLTWVDGEEFDQEAEDAHLHMRRLGAAIASLHDQSEIWRPPRGFVRPSYDPEHFRRTVALVEPAVDLGFVDSEGYDSMLKTVEVILALLQQTLKNPKNWGLIHGDLGPGNVIVHERGVSPIDFSLCGYGPFLWDLGGMLPGYKRQLHRDFYDAYLERRSLPDPHERLMEGLGLLSILCCFAFHISNPDQHEWLKRRMPKSVDGEWKKFLRGESFLFGI